MCGIFCRLRNLQKTTAKNALQLEIETELMLTRRGPDAESQLKIQINDFEMLFAGFVLWQQGSKPCQQPFTLNHHILLINGDIFSKRLDYTISDTQWLLERIDECNDDIEELFELFRDIQGPYAILYFNKNTEELYFMRDVFGRQSLLLAHELNGDLAFGSVLNRDNHTFCIEVSPLGIYRFKLSTQTLHLHPWVEMNESKNKEICELEMIFDNEHIIIEELIGSKWLYKIANEHKFNFQLILCESLNKTPNEIFEHLLDCECVTMAANKLLIYLSSSIEERVKTTPKYCRACVKTQRECNHAKIGILFSGGIDCTILAALTDKLVSIKEPIDLINASFEKVRSIAGNYDSPDRISAKQSLEELQRLNPQRKWNLVEVNTNRTQLNDALKYMIPKLIYPLNKILDESLGGVLWFGARGRGKVDNVDYDSQCRVLLIGSGADELFGGYTRHRNAFIRSDPTNLKPYERLENVLEYDFSRLPSRNLARDDRMIGDFGVTGRSPYLEERFVRFVRSLDAEQKCYHALEQGVGDKLLLRFSGYLLGLREVTWFKKRAMQFGSRIADPKQNADDISIYLKHNQSTIDA